MTRPLTFFCVAAFAVLFVPGQAAAIYYYEMLSSDRVGLADPSTTILFEDEAQVPNPWILGRLDGAVVNAGSTLGDGWLTGSAAGPYAISYTHELDPIAPGASIGEIISASVSIYVISAAAVDQVNIELSGGEGSTLLGFPLPEMQFALFAGNVTGVISIVDGLLFVDAQGSEPYQIVMSLLSAEYTPGVSSGGGQPHMPEPHAALIFPIGIVIGGLAARRARATRRA